LQFEREAAYRNIPEAVQDVGLAVIEIRKPTLVLGSFVLGDFPWPWLLIPGASKRLAKSPALVDLPVSAT